MNDESRTLMSKKKLNELADSFDLFDNWEDRYRFLIDLGQRLEPLDERYRTDGYLVKGCTSKVWLHADTVSNDDGMRTLYFRADSDAQIVKGLIYILSIAFNGEPLEQVGQVDINGAFERLGLSGHLSPNRRNGFFAMVEYLTAYAAGH